MRTPGLPAALLGAALSLAFLHAGAAGDARASEPPRIVHYITTADGDSVYVRGAISETRDVAQKYGWTAPPDRAHVDFYSTYLLTPSTPNTLAAYRQGPRIYGYYTEGANAVPMTTNNCGAVMGPHGLVVPVVTSVGHDKTVDDVGSRWSDGVRQFVLAAVAGPALTFYPVPYAAGAIWRMPTAVAGTLTHVSGASHGSDIVVTSQATTEQVVTRANVVSVLREGATPIAAGEEGDAAFLDMVEEWDVVDPSTIVQTNNPWDWTDGQVWMHVRNTHRLTAGLTATRAEYDVRRDMSVSAAFFVMQTGMASTAHRNRYYYLPNIRPSNRWAWSAPQQLNLADPLFPGAIVRPESLLVPGRPPDRMTMLFEDSTGAPNYDIGFAHGYAPFGDGSAASRVARITGAGCNYWYVNTSEKSYPNAYGSYASAPASYNLPAGTRLEVWTYRQWFDQSRHRRAKQAYWNDANGYGDDLVFVDYQESVTEDATPLPERLWGRVIEVVDTMNVTIGQDRVPAGGLTLSTTPGHTSGHAVLRLRTPEARVDDGAPFGRLGPPAPNPSRGAVTLSYAVARTGRVRLAVHDLHGRRVRTLVDAEQCPNGA